MYTAVLLYLLSLYLGPCGRSDTYCRHHSATQTCCLKSRKAHFLKQILTENTVFKPTSDMTLRLLNRPCFSGAMTSGMVGTSEGLCSGGGAASSCGGGRSRREEERRSNTLAVTGAQVDE